MIQESAKRLLLLVSNEDSDTKPFSPFIYMVPSELRKVNPSSFNPRLVSIGPLHREDEDVKAFEGQKVSYIIDLMNRINSPREEILESCNAKAYALMNRIKASYIWPKTFTDDEIAVMMVTDALFILGFIINPWNTASASDQESSSGVFHQTIFEDLILLENQIPLFFLDEMFQCIRSKVSSEISLTDLIIRPLLRVHNLFEADLKVDNISMGTNDHHILSLLHQCYAPPNNIKCNRIPSDADLDTAGVQNNNEKDEKSNTILSVADLDTAGVPNNRIPSVADLDMAGVSFKPSKDKTWVMGIKVKQYRFSRFYRFWKKTTLTMPVLKLHDSTEFLIRNLIAYEQLFQTPKYVSSYASAMDKLINTADDVAKLIDSRVLINTTGSNEEAANMIKNLCKHVICSDSYYDKEWVKLNEYCNRWWPKLHIYYNSYWPEQFAKMRSTYFSSPWNIIALIAGIVLFVLQVVQTIYTIKSS